MVIAGLIILIISIVILGVLVLRTSTSKYVAYTYKDNTYLVISKVRMKDISTGQWFKAVLYESISTNTLYVRELKDFNSKFIRKQ